ncbi:MAG: YkgJ family cysteine cluster protein [Candidatus Melainabacteria bacterium]|nr:YkgJ family cysteine cluster protein [Candidatus Melainabacteria bacterium]
MVKQWVAPPEVPQAGEVTGSYYVRSGSCNQCGDCCTGIYLIHENQTIQTHEQFEALLPKNPEYNYFKPIDQDESGLLFECVHLQENRSCGIYEHRPDFCRRYPSEASMLQGGVLSACCGYSFEVRQRFEAVLKQTAQQWQLSPGTYLP